MSGVSLQNFIHTAHKDDGGGGVIRMDATRANELINKGSTRGILGDKFHLGDPNSRSTRENDALDHFRAALRNEYGDVADKALEKALLPLDGDGMLHSHQVLAAIEHAQNLQPLEEIPNVPLRQFVELSNGLKFDEDLPMRMDARTQTTVVDHAAGYGFGIGSDPETRRTRERLALESFKKALTDEYGESIAGEAMREAGLVGATKTLTSRLALVALEHARRLGEERNNEVEDLLERYTSPDQLDRMKVPENLRGEFVEQLKRRYLAGLDATDRPLDSVLEASVETQKEIEQLEKLRGEQDQGDIARARRALTVEFANMMILLENRSGAPGELLGDIRRVDRALEALCQAEGRDELSAEERKGMLLSALRHACQFLKTERSWDSNTFAEVQERILGDDSPLRTLHRGARYVGAEGATENQEKMSDVVWLCEKLVTAFAQHSGQPGVDFGSNLSLLRDDPNVMRPTTAEVVGRLRR